MTTYWHMQMHPTDQMEEYGKYIEWILEHRQFIGLGEWDDGQKTIKRFKEEMQVNDIVALKRGKQLIALVQIIGGAYHVPRSNDPDERTKWIENRRPIRVLDWALNGETVPQPLGTLNRCSSEDAETTKIITEWHEKVKVSMTKRDINLEV